KPEPKPRKAGEKENPDDADALLIGRAEALAREGKAAEAREAAGKAEAPAARLKALVAVAGATGDEADVKAALDLAGGELKGQEVPPWLLWRLARLAAAAGMTEQAQQVATSIPDKGLRGQAQLAALRATLAATKGKADDSLAAAVQAGTGASAEAWE